MSLSYIDVNNKSSLPSMWLCKSNLERTVIGKLTDVINPKMTIKLGSLNELSFDVPLFVQRNHEQVENPLFEKLNGYYQVKVKYNNKIEYFVIVDESKSFNNDGHSVSYKLYTYAYILNKKPIKLYEETSKNLSYYAREFLKETDWSLDFVDADFDLLYRSVEIPQATVLESLFQVAEKFDAVIVWDSVNKKVNFFNPNNIGINKGLKLKEGLLLESYTLGINYDKITTRLYVYGEEGLEFRRLSPTGSNYIESFDWFIHPFEADENYNVIKSSTYMSDALCIAIRKYEAKIESLSGRFESLTTQRTNKEADRTKLEQELSVLITERNTIENELWVINKTIRDMNIENELSQIRTNTDAFPQETLNQYEIARMNAVNRLDGKELEITVKRANITRADNDISEIDTQLLDLRDSLSVVNNFTDDEILELNPYIQFSDYTNDTISVEKDLLEDGIKAFSKVNQPPINLNISLVNFLSDLKFAPLKDRIAIGDIIRFQSKTIDADIQAKIIEIQYDFHSQSFSLTIANEKDLRDDWQILQDRLYDAKNTSTVVNLDKYKWDKISETTGLVNDILTSEYDAAKNAITAGYMDLTTMDRFGLKSYEYNNSDTFLFINNAIMGITNDNLNTIEVAISKNGVHAERMVGKLILSNKVVVEDALGVIEMHSGLVTIYDNTPTPKVQLGRYPSPDNSQVYKYGLRVYDGAIDIRTSDSPNKGIQIDSDGFRAFNNNGVRTFDVNSNTGKVTIVGELSIKTIADSYRGVEIDGNGFRIFNDSGTLVFSANHFGDIYYTGELRNAYGIVSNLGGTLRDMQGSVNSLTGNIQNMTGNVTNLTGDIQNMTGSVVNLTGSIQGMTGTFEGLVTGTLSVDTVSAVNIDVNQLRANGIQVDNLSAISANMGNIRSGNIQIDDDMKIGNNLYIGNSSDYISAKSIIFSGSAGITYEADTLNLTAIGEILLEATRVNVVGDFYVNGTKLN